MKRRPSSSQLELDKHVMFLFPGNERAVLSDDGGRVYGAECWGSLTSTQVLLTSVCRPIISTLFAENESIIIPVQPATASLFTQVETHSQHRCVFFVVFFTVFALQHNYNIFIRSYLANSKVHVMGFCITVCYMSRVYLLSSCSSIIDPPDYSQPPGFGGTTQVSQRSSHAVWLIASKSISKFLTLYESHICCFH